MFLKNIFIFRERGKEGERGGEKHQLAASRTLPARDLARKLGLCPDQEWNLESSWRSFSLWDDAQPTEPHQSGQK